SELSQPRSQRSAWYVEFCRPMLVQSRLTFALTRTRYQQEQQAHQHGKVSACIRDHEPEAGMSQLRDFCGYDGSRDNDQQRNRLNSHVPSYQDKQPAHDLKCSHKMGCECSMGKPNSREPLHTEVRVAVFENALGEEDQPDGNPDKDCSSRPERFS